MRYGIVHPLVQLPWLSVLFSHFACELLWVLWGMLRCLTRQGCLRLQVNYLDGRKVKRRQQAPRWLDDFTVPGQFVAVRHEGSDLKQRLYALANSPYAARRESANLDASIVEVCSQLCCVVCCNHDKCSCPALLCTALAPLSRAALLLVDCPTRQRSSYFAKITFSLSYLVVLSHVLSRMRCL